MTPAVKIEPWRLDLGAEWSGSAARFRVWAPKVERMHVRLPAQQRFVPMTRDDAGYFRAEAADVRPGDRYSYLLDDSRERPDPVSRFQPEGVHGPSTLVDPTAFQWSDSAWTGLPLKDLLIYELHVGTVTPKGTFEAVVDRLADLKSLGITAIEIMPVAQFPGARNWGYDGVGLYAPQSTYGGPSGLKMLVDACHRYGLAVILDVVYNHLGPEGNYLDEFGPYFTDRYRTPWGRAINYDDADSDAVRHFVISNALYWVAEYHVDGLRLDAIHGIYDFSATHILRELAAAVHDYARVAGRPVHVIGESDLNDVRVIAPAEEGGHGLDAQWSDDFHHAMHAVLTGERAGYYEDFGEVTQVGTALQEGFVYTGRYSRHRRRRHGNSARDRPPQQHVICIQNHDQVGNRACGERLSQLVPWPALYVAATALLLAPQTPMLFMGEEYGETAPFQYFIDHEDPALIEAVRQGRRREFAAFGWTEVPDPYDIDTYHRSRLAPNIEKDPRQAALLAWYRLLIRLRQGEAAFASGGQHSVHADEAHALLVMHRRASEQDQALILLNLHHADCPVRLTEPKGTWHLAACSWEHPFRAVEGPRPLTRLELGAKERELPLPPFGAVVYLRRALEKQDGQRRQGEKE